MKNQESVEGLLRCLDDSITSRDRRLETLDIQYKNEKGNVLSTEYDEYSRRKKSVLKRFETEVLDYQEKLDLLCKRIRKSQPTLLELTEQSINKRGRFPRNIALGKLHVECENLDFYVPKTFSFPFKQPMYICDDSKTVLLHKVLLRLLFALPIEKQEYYVFDPIGLGKTVSVFNSLFSNEQLFPQKKVLSTTAELKEALKDVASYILDLQTNVFNIETDCKDWDSYNRRLYSQNEKRKMLPYKVFIFTSVPDAMDEECFNIFKTLIVHSSQCGILVLFSFNGAVLNTEDFKMRKTEIELKACIEKSQQLHVVFEQEGNKIEFENLDVDNVGEKFPDDSQLFYLLESVKKSAEEMNEKGIPFEEIMDVENLYDSSSRDGLIIPIGCGASGNSRIDLKIDDATTHYLVGGTTGSGKSNFLHNLIVSACCRYSPEELNIYLLDFKEGVEFTQYADPTLRHARLVATEADTEYGITVLDHLIKEQEKRYSIFKKARCNDIIEFRKKNPTEIMPRILIIIDEFQVLFGNSEKNMTIEKLTSLARLGRAAGIHMVLATQTLKGLDFGTIGSQFAGRVALKCSAEDSKLILGGTTSNNEAASEIRVPYAIVNTSNGIVSGNEKFSVSRAESSKIKDTKMKLIKKSDSLNIVSNTKVFDGQRLPQRPTAFSIDESKIIQIVLGESMSYSADPVYLGLRPRVGENILICGHENELKKSLLDSIVLSLSGSQHCEELVYVGDDVELIEDEAKVNKKYISMKNFINEIKDNPFDKKRIVIMDNCNLVRQIGYEPSKMSFGTHSEEATFFKEYIETLNENGSYIIVFCEGKNRIASNGIPKDEFNYRIGYNVNVDEKNFLLGAGSMSNSPVKKNRAFLVDNLEIRNWFRPYANGQGEDV